MYNIYIFIKKLKKKNSTYLIVIALQLWNQQAATTRNVIDGLIMCYVCESQLGHFKSSMQQLAAKKEKHLHVGQLGAGGWGREACPLLHVFFACDTLA